jgi:hypothetical protein
MTVLNQVRQRHSRGGMAAGSSEREMEVDRNHGAGLTGEGGGRRYAAAESRMQSSDAGGHSTTTPRHASKLAP